MSEVICNRCGESCRVEEAKPGKPIAWCDTCGDYADTDRDLLMEQRIAAQEAYWAQVECEECEA